MFHKPAAAITKPERQVGKCCELAFGFAGGVGAFRRLAPPEVNAQFTDEQIDRLKFAWRAAHPRIEEFWHALGRAAVDAVRYPGQAIRCGRVVFEADAAPFLWLTLPSGRQLAYPHARITQDKSGRPSISYKDNAKGGWHDERMYGGKFCENLAQAVARDLLTEAMPRLDAAGFEIILHCHDELLIETFEGFADLAGFTKQMTTIPDWAEGLPIAATTWTGERYTK
jgi:DNA polymerase